MGLTISKKGQVSCKAKAVRSPTFRLVSNVTGGSVSTLELRGVQLGSENGMTVYMRTWNLIGNTSDLPKSLKCIAEQGLVEVTETIPVPSDGELCLVNGYNSPTLVLLPP